MKHQKKYLSELFLTALENGETPNNIYNSLSLIDTELKKRTIKSSITFIELRDLWDVLKDYSNILDNHKDDLPYLYNLTYCAT